MAQYRDYDTPYPTTFNFSVELFAMADGCKYFKVVGRQFKYKRNYYDDDDLEVVSYARL